MPFGLPWNHEFPAKPCPPDAEVFPAVRAAAEDLAAELGRADALTGGWKDRPLSEALVEVALSRGDSTIFFLIEPPIHTDEAIT